MDRIGEPRVGIDNFVFSGDHRNQPFTARRGWLRTGFYRIVGSRLRANNDVVAGGFTAAQARACYNKQLILLAPSCWEVVQR